MRVRMPWLWDESSVAMTLRHITRICTTAMSLLRENAELSLGETQAEGAPLRKSPCRTRRKGKARIGGHGRFETKF